MYTPKGAVEKANLILDLISNRQEAISGNVANVDTPGYVRRDIEFSQYLNTMNSPLETQLSQKLGPSGVIEAREQTLSISDELALMQKNSILYAAAVRKMSNAVTQIKTVINVGR
ncbi:flagellar basal-body rod protein FlgB [Candidatus Gastranaerophilus sp. (ex Termes propinquus)]|nr:flagellar basal-body rod protein FlgB [Candidatus Gastranaerophilus sp. (ex Termes propinquus)]